MQPADLSRLLDDPNRTQRQKLALLEREWRAELEALGDDALLECLRAIDKKISSRKLRTARDQLIAELRRDGLDAGAPLPKPAPTPAPEPESAPESAPVDPVMPPGPHNPALEAEIARDPGARDVYQVYRDWLETEGHAVDGRVKLGPLADADDMLNAIEWHLGFIRECRLSYSSARFNGERPPLSIEDALAALLDDPGPGRFVRELTIGLARHDDNDYSGVCAVIGRRPRPALEVLSIGDFGYEECELNWSTIGDASPMWAALPRLRGLQLRAGAMRLDGIDLPQLRSLETVTGGMPPAALAAIAGASWPELERMALQIGLSHQGAATDVALIEPMLDATRLPKLTHLALSNCEFTDELCTRLSGTPLLARLRTLDVSMGTMSMAGARSIATAARFFNHLEWIDVDDNYLPDEAQALLEDAGLRVVFGSQRNDDGDERYASAFE